MRNNAKRIFSLLLVVALVFAMSLTAFAAEEPSPLTLKLGTEPVVRGSKVTVSVDATVAGVVADGKLAFAYDSAILSFDGAEAGPAWKASDDLSLQANGGKLGEVVVAFAGNEGAGAGTVLTLNFTAVGEGKSAINLIGDSSYITGAEAKLDAKAEVVVGCPASKFVDVKLDAYYHKGVDYVVSKGYMIGISEDRFAPNMTMTRGMLVTVLYRMAGSPEVTGKMPFTDVAQGRYFYKAILWASQNDIARGMTKELFVPNAPVTREQMVTFFARFAKFQGISTEAKGDLAAYTDAGQVSNFALKSMTWAVETGLIRGMTDTTLEPKGNSTRGQVATVVERFATSILH